MINMHTKQVTCTHGFCHRRGGGGMEGLSQKVGYIMSYIPPPPNHDGSAVTVIIPALKGPLHFNACLFLAGPTARLFYHLMTIFSEEQVYNCFLLYLL